MSVSEMMAQVAQAKEEARQAAQSGGGLPNDEELESLPGGAAPLEARAKDEEGAEAETTPEEATSAETEEEVEAAPVESEEEDEIRIGDKTFKSQKEAIRYAQQLDLDKTVAEAYTQGIRDSLGTQNPVPQAPPEEDNFDEKFYADPKGTLASVKEQAKQEALALIKAEQNRESLWTKFGQQYPDVRRKDAERILQEPENWKILSVMTDVDAAMKILAQKTRAEYEEIVNLRKPRTEMPVKKGAQTAPSGGSKPSVTQAKKDDGPIDFISQVRKMKMQG